MIEVNIQAMPTALRALLGTDEPGQLRLDGVLDGVFSGQIYVDNTLSPSWVIVLEGMHNTLYFGGNIGAKALSQTIKRLTDDGEVLIGMWPDDPRIALLPAMRDYDGWTIDFHDRDGDLTRFAVPEGCEVRAMDAALFQRSPDYHWYTGRFGKNALDTIMGYALLRDNSVLCGAYALPVVRGVREIAVTTYEAVHQRKGFATAACAHLIRACESAGYSTYWNCAAQNSASIALARKLGFQRERKYRLLAWTEVFDTGRTMHRRR